MIVIDTSALMSIVLGEATGPDCADAIHREDKILIAAATLTEALIVAKARDVVTPMSLLLDAIKPEVIPLTAARAHAAAASYQRWGKGYHPAALNFGDCFAHAAAHEYDCPLLYVGDDFAQTDIMTAIR